MKIAPVSAILISVAVMSACGSSNAGGDTTCGDYKAMSSAEQTEVVQSFLESKGETPSNGKVTLNKFSAKAYCATAGTDSDPIRNIDGS